MKIISKIAIAGSGLVLMGSSVFAQSLADARKAIDAEQFQKAKSMLKNLVVTQPTKDENFFYLGWVYIKQDYPDSAKAVFQKGLAANPKSALNFAGLGTVALIDKDKAGASSNFGQAIANAGKESKPYVYIAKGYLLPESNGKVDPANAAAALDVLSKGNVATAVKNKDKSIAPASNDPELFITMGEADRLLLKSNEAYTSFQTALTLDPQSPAANVALGVLWKYANNYDGAETQFKAALAIDPNYGPAYREWAETDYRWTEVSAVASQKIKEAVDQYKKYMSLTDNSVESEMRYADFLLNAGDYQALQQVATELSKSAGTNLRVYRYLAYSAYENKDYPAGLTAMNTWITKADAKRILPRDYLYLGRLQIASNQDSLGVKSLRKALEIDTTQADVYGEIAKVLYKQQKYVEAAADYSTYIAKSRKTTLNDYLSLGNSYLKAFTNQYFSTAKPKPTPDTTLLIKADTAFSYIQHKASAPVAIVALFQARVHDFLEPDRNTTKGLAKPYYEQYISLVLAKGMKDSDKQFLVESYDYLGAYYEFKEKDETKAADNYTKAKEIDPANKQALDYFKRKSAKAK